ncbi:nitroreductase [Persicitalea jodogahamensis]|uniref:Nitroreductase n=2 Tax=Persicitalea jodogahamensis TaxID=402147 RepID=A0A8J3D3W4_9BACT|nr:nitroreductase [Persicitalea jodogahamensis]
MDLLETLQWRYAAKKYNDQKLKDEQVNEILEAINLSATSAGLQPFRVFVVNDRAIREEIAKESFNTQILEASHLLVFAAFDSLTRLHIQDYMELIAKTRDIPVESLSEFQSALETNLLARTDEENFIWASKQAYIGLGTGLIAAANLKVDATPMEGFNQERVDELLELKEQGLRSVVLLSLGYRDKSRDVFGGMKKVRLPLDVFATAVS